MRAFAWVAVLAIGCTPSSNKGTASSGNGGNGGTGGTGGSVNSTGMSGSNGGVGSTGSSGSTTSGSACTPFSSWCDGNMLMNCTRSGMDATGYDCTKLTTSMYTYSCAAACPNQPSSYGPCCTYTGGTTGSTGGTTGSPTPPTCVAAITAPNTITGDNTNFGSGISCSPPSAPSCPGLGYGYVTFNDEPKTCPPSGWYATIGWDRSKVQLNVPMTGASIYVDYTAVGVSNGDCDSWSGSVTLVSDTPTWKVTFDVTCTSGPSVHLAGTLNGTSS